MSYEQQGTVGVITFDDGKANAVGHEFLAKAHAGLDQAEQEAQAVVLTGRTGIFSAGFDLKELQKGPAESTALVEAGVRLFLRVFSHPQPVIVAATGHAIAAGAFLCLAADTRHIASGDYKVGLNETAIGMSLPAWGFALASARLSRRHLTRAVTQAELYSPDAAQDVGFVDEVVPAEALLSGTIAEAARLGEMDTAAYHHNKIGWRAPFIEQIKATLPDA